MVYCPICGTENPEDMEECKKCGRSLEHTIETIKSEEREYNLLVISGYVMVILGLFSFGILSIAGLILGYKTFQQKDPRSKTHGFIIMILNLVIILFWIWVLFLIPNMGFPNLNSSITRFYR